MRKKLFAVLATCCFLVGIASTSQATLIQSEPILTNPTSTENLWGYSYLTYDQTINPISSAAYYTTLSSQYNPAVNQGYVTGDFGPWSPGVDSFSSFDGTNWLTDSRTTHVFDTFIMSSIDQTITLKAGGDDGHSIFIDDTFYAGAGYSITASTDLTMVANTPYKLSLVLTNYSGGWSSWVSLQEDGQIGSSPVSEAQYISMDATGDFAPAPVPIPPAMLLFGTGLAGLIGSRIRRKKK